MGERRWFRTTAAPDVASGLSPTPVFDPATGETHFLNELPLMLLSAINARPQLATSLARQIFGDSIALGNAELARVETALRLLKNAEIIESIDFTDESKDLDSRTL